MPRNNSTSTRVKKAASKTVSAGTRKTRTTTRTASRSGSNQERSVQALVNKASAFGEQVGSTASTLASSATTKVVSSANKFTDYVKSHPKEAAGLAIATLGVVTAWINRGKMKKSPHMFDPVAAKALQMKENIKCAVEKALK